MADLRLDLTRVDTDLDQEYEDAEEGGFPISPLEENLFDDSLTPLERLEKFYATEEIFERDLAVREIPGVIETVINIDDFEKLCYIADKLARDTEPVIRMSMLNTINGLLEKSHQLGYIEEELQRMQEGIMEIPIRMLRDVHEQVRRVTHNCLANLLEEEVGKELLLQLLCPAIVHLLSSDGNYDLTLDAISLISKLSQYLGREVMLKEFVPLFKGLSCDSMFHVRKAFAICCKDICQVLDDDSTEQHLLPLFLQLCKDEVWGVRKACADVFTDVSYACQQLMRREKLTPAFLLLLSDPSRWVRKAAYQSLGPFISTFYDPDNYYELDEVGGYDDSSSLDRQSCPESDKDVVATSTPAASTTSSLTDVRVESSDCACQLESVKIKLVSSLDPLEATEYSLFNYWKTPHLTVNLQLDLETLTLEDKHLVIRDHVSSKQSEMLHVRLTTTTITTTSVALATTSETSDQSELRHLQAVDHMSKGSCQAMADAVAAEPEGSHDPFDNNDVITEVSPATNHTHSCLGNSPQPKHEQQRTDLVARDNWNSSSEEETDGGIISCLIPRVTVTHGDAILGSSLLAGDSAMDSAMGRYQHGSCDSDMEITLDGADDGEPVSLATKQNIVPSELLDNYLSMVDQSKIQQVDADLSFHCAFSFPAVAMTLGGSHWSILSPLYHHLTGDLQWKIRRVLAYSIHEIARIVGPDVTCSELLNIFEGFLKDIDEVRVGVLSHLADFFEILPSDEREHRIVILKDFLSIDNDRNWRFRQLLIEQLIYLCELYSVELVVQHIVPIATELAHNHVAELRLNAHSLLGIIIERLAQQEDLTACRELLCTLKTDFAHSNQWILRLSFIQSCISLLVEGHVGAEMFAEELLQEVVSLAADPIPNVRLSIAKLLKQVIIANDYFLKNDNHLGLSCGSLFSLLDTLQNDGDRDVCYFSGGTPAPPSSGRRMTETYEDLQDPFEMDLRDRSFSEVERVIYSQHVASEEVTASDEIEADNEQDSSESHC